MEIACRRNGPDEVWLLVHTGGGIRVLCAGSWRRARLDEATESGNWAERPAVGPMFWRIELRLRAGIALAVGSVVIDRLSPVSSCCRSTRTFSRCSRASSSGADQRTSPFRVAPCRPMSPSSSASAPQWAPSSLGDSLRLPRRSPGRRQTMEPWGCLLAPREAARECSQDIWSSQKTALEIDLAQCLADYDGDDDPWYHRALLVRGEQHWVWLTQMAKCSRRM